MKVQNVLNCSFSSWYPSFKRVTLRSRVIPLSKSFIDYLLEDRIVLPKGSGEVQPKTKESVEIDEEDYFEDDGRWSSTAEEDMPVIIAPEFPDLEQKIRNTIEYLGGEVFPKLNWSCPKDASWISFDKSLRCTSPADIYLLLKSSDFVAHDLTCPFQHCDDNDSNKTDIHYELILRVWKNVHPGMEFRCFVKNGTLIAICQRHDSEYYSFIEDQEEIIKDDIIEFFKQNISGRFADKEYVFDIYRDKENKILLLDFNPYGVFTDSLMFSWSELLADHPFQDETESVEFPVFRCVKKEDSGMKPNPYAFYALPKDFVDLSLGTDPQKLVDFLKMKTDKNTDDSDNDDT